MPILLKCEWCSKEFKRPPSLVRKHNFCSEPCSTSWHSGKKHWRWDESERQKNCQHCGKLFQKPERRAISLFRKQKFCSKECADRGGLRHFGEDNSKWNGNPRRKHPGRMAAWRRKVLSRDNATCQQCGANDTELHAHHIKPYIDFPELRWDVDNGTTLCWRCHYDLHHSNGPSANAVKSGKPAAGNAGGNPEPSFGRKPVEGVTTSGRAYRRWTGHCDNCGVFITKQWSDTVGKQYLYCGKSCMLQHRWKVIPEKMNRHKSSTAVTSATSAAPERDDIVWTHVKA